MNLTNTKTTWPLLLFIVITGVQKGNHGRVFFPQGKWINYWNGKEENISNAQWIYDEWLEYLGGLLYVKAGAIIPMSQVKNHIDETKNEVVVWDVYPYQISKYKLYEEDGTSYNYENGAYAFTKVTCGQNKNNVNLTISARKGEYNGMPEKRTFLVKMHSLTCPKEIRVDGKKIKYFDDLRQLIFNDNNCGWYYDKQSKKSIIKLDKGWKYQPNQPDENPIATIPLTAKKERIAINKEVRFSNEVRDIQVIYPQKALVCFPSNIETLPADGMSIAKCKLQCENRKNIGKMKISIEGAAVFQNGQTEKTFASSDALNFQIKAGTQSRTAKITVMGEKIKNQTFGVPVYGTPAPFVLEKVPTLLLADGNSITNVYAKLYNKANSFVPSASSPIVIAVNGEAKLTADTVFVSSGQAVIPIKSITNSGKIQVASSFKDLKSDILQFSSGDTKMQMRINPTLMSRANWLPKHVDIFINFMSGNKWGKSATNEVSLNVYNKDKELLASYVQKAKNGEVIFKDIPYYKRAARCLFEIKRKGYDTITRKVF